jgi:secondary thiamine-phosphate synthase enzyme
MHREELYEITKKVQLIVDESGMQNGMILVYCPHTTGAITINEAADPSVPRDIVNHLSKLIPLRGDYQHSEGNSDAHIKSSIIGCSEQVLVQKGRLVLGTWQGLFFAEFDGPRTRKIFVDWIPTEH